MNLSNGLNWAAYALSKKSRNEEYSEIELRLGAMLLKEVARKRDYTARGKVWNALDPSKQHITSQFEVYPALEAFADKLQNPDLLTIQETDQALRQMLLLSREFMTYIPKDKPEDYLLVIE